MIQLQTFEAFLELYKRFIFRNRMLLESKKTNERIYFSHPTEESLILIRKKSNEAPAQQPQEEESEEDDEFYDEYDEIMTDKESEEAAKKQEENSIYTRLLKFSCDKENWVPLKAEHLSKAIGPDDKAYVCDLFGEYCYQINMYSKYLLANAIDLIESEYEYYSDPQKTGDYYRRGEALSGVRVQADASGNETVLGEVTYTCKDLYTEKFIENFEMVSADYKYAYVEDVVKKVQAHQQRIAKVGEEAKADTTSNSSWTDAATEAYQAICAYTHIGKAVWLAYKPNWQEAISMVSPLDKYFLDEIKDLKDAFYGNNISERFENSFDVAKCAIHVPNRDLYTLVEKVSPGAKGTFAYRYTEMLKDGIEFFFLNYLYTLFADMDEYSSDYEQYKENVDNFSPGYVGIGVGKKGIAESIISTAIASAATSYVNERVQYNSISKKYVVEASKEFLATPASKNFILKLMEFDVRICAYLLNSFEVYALNEIAREFGDYNDKEIGLSLAQDYIKATKYYAVYLAKKMGLKYVPRYVDDKGKAISTYSPKDLLENAIRIFPHEEEYYLEYLTVYGGESGFKHLARLMRIAGVDESLIGDIAKQEAERAEREATEKAAREKWEADEAARREEERRKAEEAAKDYFNELCTMYGDTAKNREMLFTMLRHNSLFNAFFKKAYASTDELIADVDKYIAPKSIITAKMLTKTSPKFKVMLQKAKAAYVTEALNDDDVLLVFDATLFGNGKNGFIVTKDAVWANGMLSCGGKMPFSDISFISCSALEGVSVGDKEATKSLSLPGSIGEISEIVTSIIVNQMYITEKGE